MKQKVYVRMNLVVRGIAFLWLATFPAIMFAQVTGTISGYVTDSSGAAVPQVKVTATSAGQNASTTVESNAEGFYNFRTLLPGTYTVTAERTGFQRMTQTGVTLTVNQNVRLDLTLTLGQLTQSVTVTGAAPLVDTSSAAVSGLVDDQRVTDLPLNGRNIISLSLTVPGVLNVSAQQSLSDARSGPTMDVNGGRGDHNLFTFDGAYFNNPSRNTGMNYPPPDAIQEFRIQTANFSSEYGRNPGSQVTVVSKEGTNAFHGSAWEFLRNDHLNARNFFSSSVPSLKENQFGVAAGGPIKKDKIFVFGSYQGLRDRPAAVGSVAYVPSNLHRGGDFSDLAPGTVLTDPVNPVTGQPYTDSQGKSCVSANVINPNCISPTATTLLKYVPQVSGTSPYTAVTTLGPAPNNDDMYMARVDWNQSSKHTLFGHFYLDHATNVTPIFGNLAGYNADDIVAETDNASLNDTYTISPTLVNQLVVSYLRTTSFEHGSNPLTTEALGINMPQYIPGEPISVNVGGQFSLGAGYYTRFISNTQQLRDVMSWMKGKHNFKFGGEYLRPSFIQRWIGPPGFQFDGSRSGDAMADFMLGAFASLSLDFGVRDNEAQNAVSPSFFFQDEFKVTPRFTLNYGLRYEPYLFWYDKHDRIDTVVPYQQSVKVSDAPPGILFPYDPGIPRTLTHPDWNNLAPRLGFAWDVFGDGKTSVRGAYGIFYQTINADVLAQENPPFAGFGSAYGGNIADPFGSVGQTPPPASPTGSFGCVQISTFPGYNCPLFPLPAGGVFTDTHLRSPYIQAWNFSLQRQLTKDIMLEAGYIGKIGTKLNALRTYNPAVFQPGTVYDAESGFENTASNPNNSINRTVFEPGILSPQAYLLGNDFRSWYHSFQTQVTKRMSKGLSVTASYTLAKSIDSSSTDNEGGAVSDPFNLRTERGRSDWDVRNAFVVSWLWSPPIKFSEAWKNTLLGGWTFSGITTIQSGAPITFWTGPDVALDGTGSGMQHAFTNGQQFALSHSSRNDMVNSFFNTSPFINPTCTYDSTLAANNPTYIETSNCTPFGLTYSMLGKYGNTGRGILSGPGFSNTDFAILKDFAYRERYKIQFRSEFFNAFNQVNFGLPDSYVTDGPGAFGTLRNANNGRVIQFALKLLW